MTDLDGLLTDISKDGCMAREVATGFRVIFEGAMPGGQVAPEAERVDKDSVRIGDQIWMDHNLQMPADPKNGIFVENGETYFTWDAAMKVSSSCGNGWRLPSRGDWAVLVSNCGGKRKAGFHLKTVDGWDGKGGDNAYGFGGIPAGYYKADSWMSSKLEWDGSLGLFWTSTPKGENDAYYRNLHARADDLFEDYYSKNYGMSVRLVKDA